MTSLAFRVLCVTLLMMLQRVMSFRIVALTRVLAPSCLCSIPDEIDPTERVMSREEKTAALKEQEVFVTMKTGKYECQSCGYLYDESIGMKSKGIQPETPFESIEKFRCPQCGASKKYFVPEEKTVSGFKENMKYGLGANSLTGDQKGALIFGGLFAGFLLFMSGYLLN